MKKIINWSFGSFFKTIGRIFAYLFLSLLLMLIFNKLNINFFMKINASTATNWSQGLPSVARGEFYMCTGSNCSNIGLNDNGLTLEDGTIRRLLTTNIINFDRPVIFQFPTGSLKTGYLYVGEIYLCGSKNYSDSTYSMYSGPYSKPFVSSSQQVLINYMGLNNKPGVNSPDSSYELCRLYSGLFVPNESSTWVSFKLDPNTATNNMHFAIVSYNIRELGIYSDTIKQIIDESNNNVTDAVNNVTDAVNNANKNITDSDISGAKNDSDSFFNNFDSGDTGSLMNLVKLPLKFLNNLNNKCTSITFNTGYLGNITLPCLSTTLYNQNGLAPIINIGSLILNGSIMYGCIKSIIDCVNNLKNPDNDEVEVIDL